MNNNITKFNVVEDLKNAYNLAKNKPVFGDIDEEEIKSKLTPLINIFKRSKTNEKN